MTTSGSAADNRPIRVADLVAAHGTGRRARVAALARQQLPDSYRTVILYTTLLLLLPSVYIVKPLGAQGTPASIVGVAAFVLWCARRLVEENRARPTAAHWLLFGFMTAMLTGVLAGALRPLVGEEFTAMWRGMAAVTSWVGIALTVMDGISSRARLVQFTRILLWLGVVLALLGMVQFATGLDVVPLIHVPGLVQNGELDGLAMRSHFRRVSVTSLHPIEYAAVLSMILPLAFAHAIEGQGSRWRSWFPVAAVGIALPLTVARSGMLGLAVSLLFAFAVTRGRQRAWLAATVAVLGVFLRVLVPGLVGTIASLFISAGQDNSISGRTDDYGAVADFFSQRPLLGRGLFTFLPAIYRILDDQYLLTLVEGGIVGLAGLLLFTVGPTTLALRLARIVRREERAAAGHGGRRRGTAHLLPFAIGAALLSTTVLYATFDGFSFPMCTGLFSLLVGASGAAWRLHTEEAPWGPAPLQRAAVPRERGAAPGRLRAVRRWRVPGVVAVVLLVGGAAVHGTAPSYDVRTAFAVTVPPTSKQNVFATKPWTPGITDLLEFSVEGQEARRRLSAAGAGHFTVAIGAGSLGPHTDVIDHGDVMKVSGTGSDPAAARRTVDLVVAEMRRELAEWQAGPSLPETSLVQIVSTQVPVTSVVPVHRSMGYLAVVVLAAVLGAGTSGWGRRRPVEGMAHELVPEPVGGG